MYRRNFSMKNAFNMVGFVLTICVLCGFFFDSWTALLIFIDISLFFFSSFAVCLINEISFGSLFFLLKWMWVLVLQIWQLDLIVYMVLEIFGFIQFSVIICRKCTQKFHWEVIWWNDFDDWPVSSWKFGGF